MLSSKCLKLPTYIIYTMNFLMWIYGSSLCCLFVFTDHWNYFFSGHHFHLYHAYAASYRRRSFGPKPGRTPRNFVFLAKCQRKHHVCRLWIEIMQTASMKKKKKEKMIVEGENTKKILRVQLYGLQRAKRRKYVSDGQGVRVGGEIP